MCQRITGQRQQPDTGHIFKRNDWDPDIIEKRKKKKKEIRKSEEEDEEAEEEEEEEESNEVAFPHFLKSQLFVSNKRKAWIIHKHMV